uniref:RND family efflux transporter MFP subunit n=1 Tax=uncultured bacterium CSLF43 TaxID=1091575 RepID=G4WW09_9BACT|nr:RND family efflux transporter MFP subunit [uncultured bacterium CSLF43]
MNRSFVRIALVTGLAALTILLIWNRPGQTTASAKVEISQTPAGLDRVRLACPGRVEGRTETIDVGAAIDGVVQTILVREGQQIEQGDAMAEIACEDLRSAWKVAAADAESLRQTRVRLLRGSRDEERQAAAQQVAAAKAIVEQASAQLDRMTKLRDALAISKAAYEQALRDNDVAQADLQRAERNQELVNAPPLPEDVARAEANIRSAEDKIRLAEDKLNKCTVRAPIAGTVLRVHLRQGESFALLSPRPLFSLADLSGRRIRAEVDERDVAKVHVGQKVSVACDAYPGKRFSGFVSRISPVMGRKSVRTGDPADKADRDVLEVFAALEPAAADLPLGLRTTVQFLD